MKPSVISSILNAIAAALRPLSPFTKAVVPAALSLAQLLVVLVVNGAVSTVSLTVAATGLVLAVVTFFLPNKPAPAPAPAPKP